jgi:glycosyltransferase involved in cell wall biosynthesis
LAQPFETDDLARGIAWVLEDEERHRRLSQRAREKVVQEFSIERQARAYLKLYEEVVGQ